MPLVELVTSAFMQFFLDEAGGSLMEYVLLAALVATVCTLIVLASEKII